MINFCTLFDSNYIHYGLCLHASLLKQCKEFHLFVFTFDQHCHDVLTRMSLKNVTLVSLSEFEDEELLAIKQSRSKGEYCWTCTPSVIRYVLQHYSVDSCTYVDSDLFFYSDPSVLLEAMGEASVSITDHRYHSDYDQTATSGKYCVQFMTFKNDEPGLHVLNWWRAACIEWCFNRHEDGKFGDQKYLDDWSSRFGLAIHEIPHEGAGVAPWNAKKYRFSDARGRIAVQSEQGKWDLVFFHFHGLQFLGWLFVRLTTKTYALPREAVRLVYRPYLATMLFVICRLWVMGLRVKPVEMPALSVGKKMRLLFGRSYKNIYRLFFP